MKASGITIVIFFITFLGGGCVSTPQKFIPSTDLNVPTKFLGFSVQPPNGENWLIQEKGFNWIYYRKLTKNKEKHTVVLTAMSQAVDLEPRSSKDFPGYVERMKNTEMVDSRFRAVNKEVSSLKIDGAECARVDFTAEDHGVPHAYGSTYFLQGFDTLCLHPDSPHMLIRFSYSQRFEKGIKPLTLESKIDSFIKGITFDREIHNRFSVGPLFGVYAYDKFIFFPDGRNLNKESLLLSALKEGGYKGSEVFSSSPETEQALAVEYDVDWVATASKKKGAIENLGCVLGKVGRWNEALEVFQTALKNKSQSVQILGYIGITYHVLDQFKDSAEYFQKATILEPAYFDNKVQQKNIFSASQNGVSIFNK